VTTSVGALVQAFLADELPVQRGLRPASVKAYRDGLRLFLVFVARDVSCRLTQITREAFTLDRVLRFLQDLETTRHNHRRTRNHRLTILRAFFEFLARRCPEYLAVAQQVAAIAVKRAPPPETFFLELDEIDTLLRRLPPHGRHALRDRVLFLLLYNTGARVQEIADLRIEHLDLGPQPRVRLHGQGDKWRVCPLWSQTVDAITRLLREGVSTPPPTRALFTSNGTRALTRFGLYKIVRRHTDSLRVQRGAPIGRHVGPHVFRHTAAVHLLEAGVDVNVIRGEAGVRRILGVLSLAKKHGPAVIEDAAKAALDLGVPTYRFLRRYLERRPPVPLTLKQVDPLIRQLTLYRDLIDRTGDTQ
jgi:integrase/recombinase XerD